VYGTESNITIASKRHRRWLPKEKQSVVYSPKQILAFSFWN